MLINKKIFRKEFEYLISLFQNIDNTINENEQQIIETLFSLGWKVDTIYKSGNKTITMITTTGYDLQFNPIYNVNKKELKNWIKMWGRV